MKKLISKELIIGSCVIIALAVLFFGIEYLKGVNIFRPSNYYYAVYSDVKGLTESAPVYISGYKVGQVNEIKLMYDDPEHVLVTFKLDKEVRVAHGTRALIESDLLGTATIKLEMAKSAQFYSPGDTIPSGQVEGMLDGVADNLLPQVNDIMPKVDSLLVNLNNVVGDPSIINTLRNIESMTATLNATASALNASTRQLPQLLAQVDSVVVNANRISANIAALSESISTAPIESTLENVNRISADLAALSAQLSDPNSSLGQLLYDRGLYDNLLKATADIDSLLVDIKKNPKRYISIKLL